MKGTFYVVGVGPGDPELLTLKAMRILKKCPVWLAPTARKNGPSTALDIVSGAMAIQDKEIVPHHFPMKKVHRGQEPDQEVKAAWQEAVAVITSKLQNGQDVALPTLGDPAIYSTGCYVCEALLAHDVETRVEIIPGISALGASAAAARLPLCLGDERLLVIPAIFDNDAIRAAIEDVDVVVFMKVHKSLPRLVPLLEEMGRLANAVLVERTSMAQQRVHRDIKAAMAGELHYFSTMIVRREHTSMGAF